MDSPLSEASLDFKVAKEVNSSNKSMPYYELQNVIKWSNEASENLYVVEETTIFFPTSSNTRLANVLTHALSHRKLRLQGRIVVDSDQEDQLIVYQDGVTLNGSWIVYEGDFSSFSIAFPNTLWIPTPLGHLEIRSSREYHQKYTEMMHAIGIFYVALFHYEEYSLRDGYSKGFDHIAAILNFYSVYVDGRGLFFKDVISITIKHAKFMLNEYSKEKLKGLLLGDHMFFNWLQDGCKVHKGIPITRNEYKELSPGQLLKYFERARQRMKKEYSSPEPVLHLQSLPELSPHWGELSSDLCATSSVTFALTMERPFHGSYISPQFPHGIDLESSIPEKIAALLCHAVYSGRQQSQKMKIKNLAGALYRDYSVPFRQVCHELIIIYRASIISYLPVTPPWSTSELYRELSSPNCLSVISSTHRDFEKMRELIGDYVKGLKKLTHRENKFLTSSWSTTSISRTTTNSSEKYYPPCVAKTMPELPNRDPNIISLCPSTHNLSSCDRFQDNRYGIQRATYRALDLYE